MLRLLLIVTILFFLIGIGLAFVPFIMPEVAQAMAPLICPAGSTVNVNQAAASRGGISFTFGCIAPDGSESDAGFLPYLVLFTAWCWLPLIPGTLLIIGQRARTLDRSP